MGNVPTTNLNAYYATTTPGTTIQSGPIDPALQDIVQTVNDNYALFSNFINPISGELLIPDQTIVTRHLRNLAVTTPKLGPLAVTADKIADGSITLTKLADLVVTAAKIANGTITEPKLSNGSVSRRTIVAGAVGANEIDPTILNPISDATVNVRLNQLDEQVADIAINVKNYGAVPGGLVDSTIAIQTAVNACPAGGTVHGAGEVYLVSKVFLKSDMTFKDFSFLTLPSSADFVSPVTIGLGGLSTVSNVTVSNVSVNGQRSQQTSIGSVEDGGRHGFRLIGRLKNILIDQCAAYYCASDGICIFSGGAGTINPVTPDEILTDNIRVTDCDFQWNRRHGGSGDSTKNISFIRCNFNNNGQNINGGATEGDQGAKLSGSLYASGFDMEGYSNRSSIDTVLFDSCFFLQNVRSGLIFVDPTAQNSAGFIVRKNIRITGCTVDAGTIPIDNGTGIVFTPIPLSNKTLGTLYQNIEILNCNINGNILLRSCDRALIDGGQIINAWTYAGTLDNSTNVHVGSTQLQGKIFFKDTSVAEYAVRRDNIGTLSTPLQSFCKINVNNAQSFTANTTAVVQYNSKEADIQSEFDASQYRFTAKTAGVFFVQAAISFAAQTANNTADLTIYKNGSYFGILSRQMYATTGAVQVNGTYALKLNAGDYIEIRFKSLNAMTCQTGYDMSYLLITKMS